MDKMFSGAKKTSSDHKSSTFSLPNGHKIMIAHSGLSSAMKKKLDEMPIHAAEGVDIDTPHSIDTDEYGKPVEPGRTDWNQNALRGSAGPQKDDNDWDASTGVMQGSQPSSLNVIEDAKQNTQNPSTEEPQSPQTNAEPEAAQEEPQTAQTPEEPKTSIPSLINPAISPEDHKLITKDNMIKEDQASQNDLANGHIDPLTYHKLLWQEQQPDGSWKDKGTLGKVGTMFGLLLGGIGSGLTHQPMAIMQMMNNTIEKDLEAQKTSKANAQNLYQLELQHQLNQSQIGAQNAGIKLTEAQTKAMNTDAAVKANAFARAKMNRDALAKMSKLVQGMPANDPRLAGAQQTLAMMSQAVNAENYNLFDVASAKSQYFKQLFGDQSQPTNSEQQFQQRNKGLRMLGPEGEKRADYEESHHVPYVPGITTRAATPDLNEQVTKMGNFQNLLKEATDLNDKLGRRGAWTPTETAEAARIHAELVTSYNDVKGLNRFTGEESKLYDKIVPDLGRVNITGSNKAVLQQLNDSVQSKKKLLYRQMGLPEDSLQKKTSSSGEMTQEGQTGTSKSGKPIVFMNGKWKYK